MLTIYLPVQCTYRPASIIKQGECSKSFWKTNKVHRVIQKEVP